MEPKRDSKQQVSLSPKQLQILEKRCAGQKTADIAKELHIDEKTVLSQCTVAYEKLGIKDVMSNAPIKWEDVKDRVCRMLQQSDPQSQPPTKPDTPSTDQPKPIQTDQPNPKA